MFQWPKWLSNGEIRDAHYHMEILDVPFLVEDILEAIKDMPKEKAPGRDGYTIEFYEKSWNVSRQIWSRSSTTYMLLMDGHLRK